jgi:glycosyltransferase involved in cell wall biosynthesis
MIPATAAALKGQPDNAAAPLVSVLLPCYNAQGTLDETLDSLHQQSLSQFEIVAVDDGSSDATWDRLQAHRADEPRLRPMRIPHAGIVAALNAGLAECRAPLIARMDADDLAHPHRLAEQMAFLQANPEIAAVGCLVEGFPEGGVREGFRIYLEWLNSLVGPESIAREIFIESPLAHPSVMIRRQCLERAGGYQDHGWPEDYDLWLRLHLLGARFAKVPRVLLQWREHTERLTRTDSRYSVENFLRAKAHYLMRGPLSGRDGVILWGAGQMGRRISKHLQRAGAPLQAFVDIAPGKVGRKLRGLPIIRPDDLPILWGRHRRPALLAAVASRGARPLIREQLGALGLSEGEDWWAVA